MTSKNKIMRRQYRKGKTDRKRYRRMCHGDYSYCTPEERIVKGEDSERNPNWDHNNKKSKLYITTKYIHRLHFKCTKNNKEPRIEDITGDETNE
jgi:transposase